MTRARIIGILLIFMIFCIPGFFLYDNFVDAEVEGSFLLDFFTTLGLVACGLLILTGLFFLVKNYGSSLGKWVSLRTIAITIGVLGAITSIGFLLYTFLWATPRQAVSTKTQDAPQETVQGLVLTNVDHMSPSERVVYEFGKDHELTLVALCESEFQHIDPRTGRPKRNPDNPAVVGMFQINTEAHRSLIREGGYDPYTLDGNIALAKKLFEMDKDLTDWKASESCRDRLRDQVLELKLVAPADGSYGNTIHITDEAIRRWGKKPFFWTVSPPPNPLDNVTGLINGSIEYVFGTQVSAQDTKTLTIQNNNPGKDKVYYVLLYPFP